MLSILPLVVLFASAELVLLRSPEGGRLRAVLIGALLTALWAFIGAEVLSLLLAFDRFWITLWWGTPAALLIVAVLRAWRRRDTPLSRPRGPELAMAIACVALLGLTGAIALFTPPTTHDCLSYHLPRQLFWIQQHGVQHFATPDLRQLEMPPFAEFMGAELMLLSGTDHQANMVQWFAYALSAVAAAAVARELGAGSRGMWLAALLMLSQPMAAIQSLNPKNDVVCSFLALVALYSSTRLMRGNAWSDRCMLAVSLGLMILTKGTGFLVAAPLVAVVGLNMIVRLRWHAVMSGLVMGLIVMSINVGHWSRNYHALGSPISLPASRGGFALSSTLHSPRAIVSSLIRNVSLHTGTPWAEVNQRQTKAIETFHEALGIPTTDPGTTLLPHAGFSVTNRWNHDGGASAPVHLLLIAALTGAVASRWYRPARVVMWLFATTLCSAVLFCVVLKWQPWHGRLHLPFFAIVLPFVATWMERWSSTTLKRFLAVVGFCLAFAAVLWNETKPIVGKNAVQRKSREEIMFAMMPARRAAATATADEIGAMEPRVVGVALDPHTCEYAIMRLILDRVSSPPRFVSLLSIVKSCVPENEPEPDVVCMTTLAPPVSQLHTPTGTRFDVHSTRGVYYTLTRGLGPKDLRLSQDAPPFLGWESDTGLGRLEGPYPQWDLPVVRWGVVPATVLKFSTDQANVELLVECRRGDLKDVSMTVTLNGEVIGEQDFGRGWVWIPIRLPMCPIAGPNELALVYKHAGGTEPTKAVLFRRLQIVPSSWLDTVCPKLPNR